MNHPGVEGWLKVDETTISSARQDVETTGETGDCVTDLSGGFTDMDQFPGGKTRR
jgi:hypothetical protein